MPVLRKEINRLGQKGIHASVQRACVRCQQGHTVVVRSTIHSALLCIVSGCPAPEPNLMTSGKAFSK